MVGEAVTLGVDDTGDAVLLADAPELSDTVCVSVIDAVGVRVDDTLFDGVSELELVNDVEVVLDRDGEAAASRRSACKT